jgi:hypothetical protein
MGGYDENYMNHFSVGLVITVATGIILATAYAFFPLQYVVMGAYASYILLYIVVGFSGTP